MTSPFADEDANKLGNLCMSQLAEIERLREALKVAGERLKARGHNFGHREVQKALSA